MVDIRSKKGLPAGWIKTELGDLCEVVRGGSPRPMGSPKYFNGDIPFIKISDVTKIKTKNIYDSDTKVNEAGSKKSRLLPKGSLILSNSGTICVPKFLGVDACIHDGFVSFLNLNNAVSKEYLFHFFHFIRPYIIQKHKQGVTQVNLNTKIVSEFDLLLPPAEEQNQIVAKIEELFSELDNGIESLKKAREQLKTYRQAVLKYAFEGKLTKEWRTLQRRAGNPPEPAEKLLEQIKTEREKRYQKQLEDWKKACEQAKTKGHKKPAKPRKPKELPPLSEKELAELPELAEGWDFIKIGNITLGVEYGSSAKSKKEGKVPVLRMGNIQNFVFDWTDLVYSNDDEEINKYLLRRNDILFNRTNSPELVGKTALYQGERPAIFAGYLIRINQIRRLTDAKYLNYFLNSCIARNYGNRVKTDGVNQSNINGEKLSNYPIPYTAIEEQRAIVSEIESRLSVCDKIEQTIEDSLKKAEALRQSILKKAFSGELTRDWREKHLELITGENSAEKLLEKIKAEKALASGRKKPRSKKTKKK